VADCPNCGTEVRPEWSLCPHCKVNMRSYTGPRGGYVQPVTPVRVAPPPVPPVPVTPAPPAVTPTGPAPAEAAAAVCPHCGASLPSPDARFCPQCGDPISERLAAARLRRLIGNRYLVGALAVVFTLLIIGIVLAGQGEGGIPGSSAKASDVVSIPSPTVTAVVIRTASSQTPVGVGPGTVPGAKNASANVTPHVNETVVVIKTLDRYIQNAGGDASQLRTPALPATPPPPSSPVPTSASGPLGNLTWSGEGTYVTEEFALDAGTIQVEMTAGALTMAQLRDAAGTAIGIATAGPQPASTSIRVAAPGSYRLEVWPFGAGSWTVTISYAQSPTAAPTLAPETAAPAAPVGNVTSIGNVPPAVSTAGADTPAPTAPENLTAATTEVPTTAITSLPTQPPRTFTGSGTAATPAFPLNEGLAVFSYSTSATGTFSVTLLNATGAVTDSIAGAEGPFSESKAIAVPVTGSYLMNVAATGPWEISIA
jgi:uncharacterized OB-fold protein